MKLAKGPGVGRGKKVEKKHLNFSFAYVTLQATHECQKKCQPIRSSRVAD